MFKNIEKFLFFISVLTSVAGALFALGFYSATSKNTIYANIEKIKQDIKLAIRDIKHDAASHPIHFLQPSSHSGEGVTKNLTQDDGLIFISGFFSESNALKLINRDGSLVNEWIITPSKFFTINEAFFRSLDWNIDIHGAAINPDGSVVFNVEYLGAVKLSACGDLIWTLKNHEHHSVEKSETGGYWIPGRRFINSTKDNKFPPLTTQPGVYMDDLIQKISEDGKVIIQKSIVEILYENGLESLLTANGHIYKNLTESDKELVHANKITELPQSFASAYPTLSPNDIAISLRQYNLIFIVDPNNWEIKWHQTGPWLRQHDPEFNDDGTITLFNNNTYRDKLGELDRQRIDTKKVSNIMQVDIASGETKILYGESDNQNFLSTIRGKIDILPNKNILVTSFEEGRLFEFDSQGDIVWEFINRYNGEYVAELTEGRYYPRDYFSSLNWNCQ